MSKPIVNWGLLYDKIIELPNTFKERFKKKESIETDQFEINGELSKFHDKAEVSMIEDYHFHKQQDPSEYSNFDIDMSEVKTEGSDSKSSILRSVLNKKQRLFSEYWMEFGDRTNLTDIELYKWKKKYLNTHSDISEDQFINWMILAQRRIKEGNQYEIY